MKYLAKLIILLLLQIPAGAQAGEDGLTAWRVFSRSSDAKILMTWMQCNLKADLNKTRCARSLNVPLPPFYGQLGVFVTLVKNGKVRGCFGAFDHVSDQKEDILKDYLRGALKRDSRYKSLLAGEADDVNIIITIAGSRLPVDNLDNIDVMNYGVLATFDNGQQDVIVPSEIKNIDALKRRLKDREINQIEAFRSVTIK